MDIIFIILKDLKILLSDKKATAILILMPIVLISILGSALKSSFLTDIEKPIIKVAVVLEYDQSKETEEFINFFSRNGFVKDSEDAGLNEMTKVLQNLNLESMLIEDFLENEEVKKIISYEITHRERAKELLQNGKVSGIIIMPENFVYDMYINFLTPFRNTVNIQVLGHPDRYISSQIIEGIMRGFADGLSATIIGKNVFIEAGLEEGVGFEVYDHMEAIISNIAEAMESSRIKINHITANEKKPISGTQYYASAMIGMFVLFCASMGGKLLLKEKKDVTYQRTIIAGIEKWRILSGKFFTIFLLGLVQVAIIILVTSLVYKVRWGNILYVVLISLCTVFSVAGIGILISALTLKNDNYMAANVFESVFINGMALLGGSFMPIDAFPEPMKVLSNFTVTGLTIKSYQRVMMDYGIEKITPGLLGLILMGIVFILLAVLVIKGKKEEAYAEHNKAQIAEI
ncbi:MAG: ABC transporter permease [Gottschalkiaceae bacterium]|nr:MAG: ABC transporter permease [Gottschalkiaceae bacterium]